MVNRSPLPAAELNNTLVRRYEIFRYAAARLYLLADHLQLATRAEMPTHGAVVVLFWAGQPAAGSVTRWAEVSRHNHFDHYTKSGGTPRHSLLWLDEIGGTVLAGNAGIDRSARQRQARGTGGVGHETRSWNPNGRQNCPPKTTQRTLTNAVPL